jgi:hypothetical protein
VGNISANRQENGDLPPCSSRFWNANYLFFFSGFGLEKLNCNRHCWSVTMRQSSYWSWLVTVDGDYIDFQVAQMLVDVTRMLAVFLVIIIIVEVAVAVYAYFEINEFAEETLSGLH